MSFNIYLHMTKKLCNTEFIYILKQKIYQTIPEIIKNIVTNTNSDEHNNKHSFMTC